MIKSLITPKIIAEVVGCSSIHVIRVMNGNRNRNTKLGQRIFLTKIILEQRMQRLIIEVKDAILNNQINNL